MKDYTATNDTTQQSIQDVVDAALNDAGIADAKVEVRDFQKTKATTEAGNTAYYVCGGNGGCGKWFSDAAGTQEITDKDSVLTPKTGHSYSISTPAAELEGVLLTEGEKQQVQNGTDVTIVLEVQDAGTSVSKADKDVVEAALGGKPRRYAALALIFLLLAYYHSMGKKSCAEWKEVYGK